MKSFALTVTIAALATASALTSSATIWRLNNNGNGTTPAITGSFPSATTLQQAHDNASVLTGDTIHVEQSPTSYGDCVFTKKLTLIGAGYFLNKYPTRQVNTSYGSPVGSLTMKAASCAGSSFMGLTVNGFAVLGANNITAIRNYFPGLGNTVRIGSGNATAIDNINLSQNFILCGGSVTCISEEPGTTAAVTNLTISNNFIKGVGNFSNLIILSGYESGILKNNVLAMGAFGSGNLTVSNMYVVNNITDATGGFTFNNSIIEYNLATTTAHFSGAYSGANNTAGPGNLINTTIGYVTSTSDDGMYDLLPASPAKGTGKTAEDMGMFGGTLPYKLSGIPTVPNIYALSIAPIAAGATSISVTVSTKSN